MKYWERSIIPGSLTVCLTCACWGWSRLPQPHSGGWPYGPATTPHLHSPTHAAHPQTWSLEPDWGSHSPQSCRSQKEPCGVKESQVISWELYNSRTEHLEQWERTNALRPKPKNKKNVLSKIEIYTFRKETYRNVALDICSTTHGHWEEQCALCVRVRKKLHHLGFTHVPVQCLLAILRCATDVHPHLSSASPRITTDRWDYGAVERYSSYFIYLQTDGCTK